MTENPGDFRAILRESYNKYAQERDSSEMQDWKVEERAKFLALMQQENKKAMLEIGAGPGRDSKFFQDQGLEPVCIDLSPAMVALCQQKGLNALVMDTADLQFPDETFDAVYAMNCLLHLPKAELPVVLKRIDALLKPGGLVYIGVYGGRDQEGIWEDDRYEPHRFFSFFTDEAIVQMVEKVFDVLSFYTLVVESNSHLHFQSLTLRTRK